MVSNQWPNGTITYTGTALLFVLQGYAGESVFPDFTNPASIKWWTQQVTEFNNSLEFDGVWIVSYHPRCKYPLEVDMPKFHMEVDPDL